MIRDSVYLQRRAMKILHQAAQEAMQIRPQFIGNERQAILCAVNDVIQEIRIRHRQIVSHKSSDNRWDNAIDGGSGIR